MYTLKLTEEQLDKLGDILEGRNWEHYTVPYARYAYKTEGVNVVGYNSKKVVISGKGTEEFVQFTLEGEVTHEAKLGYDEVNHPEWFEPHAGLDEAGKGDFFGPLVTACVIADTAMIKKWREQGIKDSKSIVDSSILKKDKIIRETPGVVVEIMSSSMERYNEMMAKPKANLNLLLAWMHARGLEKALTKKMVPWGMLDQFSKTPLTQRYFKGPKEFDLRMMTKAEADPVVAAASIVARAEFVRSMDKLSAKLGQELPKGSSSPEVSKLGQTIFDKQGEGGLNQFAKMHFKTAKRIMGLPVEDKKQLGRFYHRGTEVPKLMCFLLCDNSFLFSKKCLKIYLKLLNKKKQNLAKNFIELALQPLCLCGEYRPNFPFPFSLTVGHKTLG